MKEDTKEIDLKSEGKRDEVAAEEEEWGGERKKKRTKKTVDA